MATLADPPYEGRRGTRHQPSGWRASSPWSVQGLVDCRTAGASAGEKWNGGCLAGCCGGSHRGWSERRVGCSGERDTLEASRRGKRRGGGMLSEESGHAKRTREESRREESRQERKADERENRPGARSRRDKESREKENTTGQDRRDKTRDKTKPNPTRKENPTRQTRLDGNTQKIRQDKTRRDTTRRDDDRRQKTGDSSSLTSKLPSLHAHSNIHPSPQQ
ncbi:hypothetical protein BDV95DRAFT_186464 [Massariosphaeria phaeospora]|uniref:Uncharacterized protein n=1 Tax=Massariosphaeria phaeospora TaxID=100035 RepID=A0A7C8M471_9PLEO|nr:hypothetical protein BDV95DRAFT_186464 [Massariosphaeria phaeospora]